jgi:hypothetical protein
LDYVPGNCLQRSGRRLAGSDDVFPEPSVVPDRNERYFGLCGVNRLPCSTRVFNTQSENSVIHCPEGTTVMSPQKKHCALQWGGRKATHNIFNRGPTKQLSSYSLCRTTLFVFTKKCIPHYFATALGTAFSKPNITVLVLNISHITFVSLTPIL